MMSKDIFNEVLCTIENDDIKQYAQNCVDYIDPWFWIAPAASSGLHHPKTSLGEGGLARHTVSVVRLLNYMLEVESIQNMFTSRERDLMRVAAMMHDSKKSGNQADYEADKHTKFEHPLLAAEFVKSIDGLGSEEKEFVAHVIESHMGQWNTSKRSNVVLPKPIDKYQIIVHLADYIASRRDIEMRFDMMPEYKEAEPDIDTWKFTFGKYSGKTIKEVYDADPCYIKWAKANMEKEPARTLLQNFLVE